MADTIDFDAVRKSAKERHAGEKAKQKKKEYTLVKAEDVIVRPHRWLWEGHLLRGALEMLTGIPGLGKSMLQCDLVARVTTGRQWPNDDPGGPPANVIMLTAEDNLDQEVVPRLRAANADLSRVHILKCIRTDDKEHQFFLVEDLDMLEKAVATVGDVTLITVDPITAYMGGAIDSHKATEVRSQLGPLKDFAEKMNVAISAITHPAKNAGQKAIDHFIGSQAFVAACRIAHLCIPEMDKDENDSTFATGRILYAHAKHNPSERMPTLAFKKESYDLQPGPKDPWSFIKAVRVVWDKVEVDITADQAIREAASGDQKERGKQAEVQEFLSNILKDGEPIPKKDIEEQAAKLGFTDKQLKTAKSRLGGVHVARNPGGFWTWQLIEF